MVAQYCPPVLGGRAQRAEGVKKRVVCLFLVSGRAWGLKE